MRYSGPTCPSRVAARPRVKCGCRKWWRRRRRWRRCRWACRRGHRCACACFDLEIRIISLPALFPGGRAGWWGFGGYSAELGMEGQAREHQVPPLPRSPLSPSLALPRHRARPSSGWFVALVAAEAAAAVEQGGSSSTSSTSSSRAYCSTLPLSPAIVRAPPPCPTPGYTLVAFPIDTC